jgi:hypothetical protein
MCDYLGLRMNITKNSFVIYSKELYDYLLPLGYSNEKYIPSEVFTLNKECLNIFLDNYVRGDGHERTHGRYNSVERSVFTSSVRLRDDLSYLILLCGYCPSISLHSHKGTIVEHKNGTYTQNYDIYGIRINSSKYASYSGLTVDRVDYDDYTYCVELPKWHTLWVMRNGKTSWNGNCRCVPYFITENEKPKDAVMVEPTTRETETTTIQTETSDEYRSTKLLDGDYEKYTEISESGRELDVYKFKNIELAFETQGTAVSFEELKTHIDNLPEGLQTTNAKRIEILSTTHNEIEYQGNSNGVSQAAGLYYSGRQLLRVFNTKEKSKEYVLNIFDHEYGHGKDLDSNGVNK